MTMTTASSTIADMHGKTVVITGGTSGIGEVVAVGLARAGARIVLVARDQGRAEATMRRLRAANSKAAHALHIGNLAHLHESRRVGAAIAAAEPRIDVLINNAGAVFTSFAETEDGFEQTFATNHLAYAVMAEALRERLIASAPSRIVNTASEAHRMATLDWTDLQSKRNYSGLQAYCRSKLYNILLTRELAARLRGTGVTANCLHPGFVASRFGDNNSGLARLAVRGLKTLFAISPEKGAETIVFLASSPACGDITGGYFAKCKPAATTKAAADEGAARRLWDLTQEMIREEAPLP